MDSISSHKVASLSTAFVALAALCWGLSGGIGGILMAQGWAPVVVSFYRGAIGLLLVLAWLALRPRGSGLASRRLWFWSAIAGLGVAGNFPFYFMSIAEGSVAVAATLMYCAPVFVYLVSFTLKLERPTLFKWAAIAVLVTILIWLVDADQTVAVLKTSSWPLFQVLGVPGAGLSFIFYIVGLNHTAPAVASIVAMVEPVTASLFGVLVLNESLAALQIFGMGLILVTVTALSVYSSEGRL